MNALEMIYSLLLFSVVATGLGYFAVETLDIYGVTTVETDFTALTDTADVKDIVEETGDELLEQEGVEVTGLLGVVTSIGSIAWSSLKLLMNMVNIFTTLPGALLQTFGLAGGSWVIGYITAAISLAVVVLMLKAATGVNL